VFEYLGVGEHRFSIQHPADPLGAPHDTFPGIDLILYREIHVAIVPNVLAPNQYCRSVDTDRPATHCCGVLRAVVTQTRPSSVAGVR
jgi:hypothetical protein